LKAAVFEKANSIVLTERPVPVIEAGEALVKVKRVGICGSDIHVLHGHHASAVFPLIPGHEIVGEVIEIKGKLENTFKPGDLVATQEVINCGICDACTKGSPNVCKNLKVLGINTDGGFAEYVKVLADKLVKIPKDIDLDLAAAIEPLAVAVHDVRKSGLKAGETALVIGGGPIGLLNAIVCRLTGAGAVVISEPSEYRRNFIEKMGFTVVDPFSDDFDDVLNSATNGDGFDVAFEAAGVPDALNTCLKYTKQTGIVMVIAIAPNPYPINTFDIFAKELTLVGVRIHTMYAFKSAAQIMASGVIDDEIRSMISRVYDIDDVVEAFDYAVNDGTAFKTLVKF